MLLAKKRGKKKFDTVTAVCRELRCKVDQFFARAAEWANTVFGKRIRNGVVRQAVGEYRHRGRVPDWVTRFIDNLRTTNAINA